jgi:SAM-dependent methyltransferase
VGCGVGHWGRAWLRVLPGDSQLTGIDREPAWIDKARQTAARAGLGARCQYLAAPAQALPFAAGSFDVVTCQTLLIHVPDARAVLKEMMRVTRPGGVVIAAEPNNAANPVIEDALGAGLSVEQTAQLVQFHLTCLRGKAALGLGDESVGRQLPGLFAELGLTNVAVCQNEKTCPLVPPYDTPRERAIVEELRDWARREFWIWDRADTSRYFLAGHGQEADFDRFWQLAMLFRRQLCAAIENQNFTGAGGALFYLVAGRKS